jgi:hypothetical protein
MHRGSTPRPAAPKADPVSTERQYLLGIGDNIHRLASECSHPLPFKQENLDLIRGNFAQLGNICIGLVEVMTLQLERIEALEASLGK